MLSRHPPYTGVLRAWDAEGLELALREPCHLFEPHFPAQRRHRVHHDQAAYAFLSLPISACSFLVIARRNGRFISFCASLLSFWLCTSRRRIISASSVSFSFSSSAYLSADSTRERPACWWRIASRRSLRRLISFFQLLSWDCF